MYLTIQTHLKTTAYEEDMLRDYQAVFHEEIEKIIKRYQKEGQVIFYPYKWVNNAIAFHSKNQVLHFAEVFYQARKKQPLAKYSKCFSSMAPSTVVQKDRIRLFFGVAFRCRYLDLKTALHDQQWERITQNKIVTVEIVKQQEEYYAYILLQVNTGQALCRGHRGMGIDIGMRCPAVCYTCDGRIRFIGKGRQIRYQMRHIKAQYERIDKHDSRKLHRFNHRLHNYKKHIDHCVSKEIITFALQEHIDILYIEKLVHMRRKFHRHEQICWSYERLQRYIRYKAELAGLRVCFVDPRLTSKRCPNCGKINNVKGRTYACRCGFHQHRDVVGAMNILHAPAAS